VGVGCSIFQRYGEKRCRACAADGCCMTTRFDVIHQCDHPRGKAPLPSIGRPDLELAIEHHDELSPRCGMGLHLANLDGHRHEDSAAGSYCCGDKQRRHVLGVRSLGLWNVEFVKPRPPRCHHW
jgi:hypothetical protein